MNRKPLKKWRDIDNCRTRIRFVPPSDSPDPQMPRLPLLLIHGLGCSSDSWTPSLHLLANDRFRLPAPVIVPDMPGYGRSQPPQKALTIRQMADWSVRVLDLYQIERAHLVGNSMGCQVAMAMARNHPTRVGGMVLQGPTTGTHLMPPWRYVTGIIGDTFGESPIYNIVLIRMYAQMGLVRYFQTVKHMMDDDPVAHADQVKSPVLVVRGGRDSIIPEEAARKLAGALPDAVYTTLDHTAHAIEFTAPELFVPATVNFLYRIEAKITARPR